LKFGEIEFGEMKRNTSNWSNFACFYVARVWQRQLGFLVPTAESVIPTNTTQHALVDYSFPTGLAVEPVYMNVTNQLTNTSVANWKLIFHKVV